MLNVLRTYVDHYRRFGVGGVSFLLNSKKQNDALFQIKLKQYKSTIKLRQGTSDVNTFYKIFYFKEYDIPLGFEPKVIIDCGANIGLASIFFSNKYPNADIYSIEPEKSNFGLLKSNCKAYPNITCLNFGLWNKTTNLKIEDGFGHWGFRTTETEVAAETTISALSIDNIIDKYGIEKIDLLKIDIEGAEREVFEKNFESWLPKVKMIVIELHDNIKEDCSKSFFNALNNYKYVLTAQGENFICELRDNM